MSTRSKQASSAELLPAKALTASVPEGAHSFIADVGASYIKGSIGELVSCPGCYHVAALPRDL